jgi:hypothetical protein
MMIANIGNKVLPLGIKDPLFSTSVRYFAHIDIAISAWISLDLEVTLFNIHYTLLYYNLSKAETLYL